jgi:eukaryotic-like serine/threonine-protein kinase
MKTGQQITILVFSCVAAVCAGTWWPMFRGNNARTGYCADSSFYPGTAAWVDTLGGPIVSSPAIVNNVIYVGSRDSCMYAINALTGTVIWKHATGGWMDASPLVDSGLVIAGSRDGYIHMLDAVTGEERAELIAGLQLSSPAITAQRKLVTGLGNDDVSFGVYDLEAPNWASPLAQWTLSFPQVSYSSPALAQGTAIIGANDGTVYGINLLAKAAAWTVQTAGLMYLSTPAVDDSIVYATVGTHDPKLYAIRISDGGLIWSNAGIPDAAALAKTQSRTMRTLSPAFFHDYLLRLSPESRTAALRNIQATGVYVPPILFADCSGLAKRAGTAEFYDYGDMRSSSAAVGPDAVYAIYKELGYPAPLHSLFAFDKATGAQLWQFSELRNTEQMGYFSSPVVVCDKVFFGWGEGKVYGLDCHTGAIEWSDSIEGNIVSSPAAANGMLVFATMQGRVACYKTGTTPVVRSALAADIVRMQFNRTGACLSLNLAKRTFIDIRLFSLAGRCVKVIADKAEKAGTYVFPLATQAGMAKQEANSFYLVRAKIGDREFNFGLPIAR